jgi:hypothetical protein
MDTGELIDAALEAKAAFDAATTNANVSIANLQQAAQALTAANQALHDDLSANGPAVRLDNSATPPAVTLYTPVDPDTYAATPVRVAGE